VKILGVTPYYLPEGGGLERYAHEVFRRLAARGHEVHVACFTHGSEGTVDVVDGVTVGRCVPRFRVSNTPVDPGFRKHLLRILETYEPDVVNAHGPVPFPAEMAALACRRTGTPFVYTYHAGRLTGGSALTKVAAAVDRHTLEARALWAADRLIGVSQFVQENALRKHQEKVHIIPPGVDPLRFPASPYPKGSQDILYVGGVSRSYRWKGLHVLYDAFLQVAARFPDATLTLVGGGDLVDHYRQRATADGVGDRVHLLGRQDDAGLLRAYQRSAMVCLPSISPAESFGMVLAEGNACARPGVGTRVGGIPEVITDGLNGLLVPPNDANALALALGRLLADPQLAAQMGEAGHLRILQHHDWGNIARRTEHLLLEAAGYTRLKTQVAGPNSVSA